MVYKCCIVGCRSNYTVEEANTVFSFPKERILGKDGLNLSKEKTGYQHRRRTFVKIISNPNILEKAKRTSATL